MTTPEPVNPGPLVMSDLSETDDGLGYFIIALDHVDGAPDAMDYGTIAEMDSSADARPNWQGHAAWLVRASGVYEPMRKALTDMTINCAACNGTGEVRPSLSGPPCPCFHCDKARTVLKAAQT